MKVGRRTWSRRAYTLVEVLVVVGVIGVLVGLLVPAVSRARQVAGRVKCAAVLRQYALANQLYVSEYRDWWLPVKWGLNPNPGPNVTVPPGLPTPTIEHQTYPNNPAFRKYLRARDAGTARVPAGLVCPRAVLAEEGGSRLGYTLGRSYGYNSTGLKWYAGPTIYYTGWKRKDVRSPASKLMFVDATDSVVSMAGSGKWELYGEQHGPAPMNGITAYRHERGANLAYWDGHVGWVAKEDVVSKRELWRPADRD